jgi:hypothetical protein
MFLGYAIADRLGGAENPQWRGLSQAPSEPSNLALDSKGEAPLSELPVQNLNEDQAGKERWMEELARHWRNMSEETLERNLKGLATWLAGR